VSAPGDYDNGEIGGMIGRGNLSTRRKPAPVLLCPPQTPHAARMRTRAAAVGSQRLTTELRHGLAPAVLLSTVKETICTTQLICMRSKKIYKSVVWLFFMLSYTILNNKSSCSSVSISENLQKKKGDRSNISADSIRHEYHTG
jgi:hypothetical protein